MSDSKNPDQIVPGNQWYKGMARIPGSGRRAGQITRRKKLLDYISMLESTCDLETADPGKFLLHIAGTGRDPRHKGMLREKFKYSCEAEALAAMHLATSGGKKIEIPVAGRDYPFNDELRVKCAMKMVQHIYPRLGLTKLELTDNGDQAEESNSSAIARQLSAVPEVRESLERIAQAMNACEVVTR